MAQLVSVTVTDDIDKTPGAETVTFAFGHPNRSGGRVTEYEIDLNPKNLAAFEKALSKYIEHGRKVTARRRAVRVRASRSNGHDEPDTAAIRAWAAENGIEVSARGRMSADVVEKYQAAH